MRYYLEYKEGTSHKFWQLELDGNRFVVTFGKAGTAGQIQQKVFASPEEAFKEAGKLVDSKRKKGYADAEAPVAAPTSPKPPVLKQVAPTTAAPPSAGPAPLADDGEPKSWNRDCDEEDKAESWFDPERLRQGLDEPSKDTPQSDIPPVANPARLKRLLAAYKKEDYPRRAFTTACIKGELDNAIFLYETVIEPLGKVACENALINGAENIIESWTFDINDLALLHWIFTRGIISINDVEQSPETALMEYYVEQAELNPEPDHLDALMRKKIDTCYEEAMPLVLQALRGLAGYARTGASFTMKKSDGLDKMVDGGQFAKGAYGLRLRFLDEKVNILISVEDNPSNSVSIALPSLAGFDGEMALPYLKQLLAPQLDALWQEGVFNGLFEDAFLVQEDYSKETLFRQIINPAAAQAFQAQIEQLEGGEIWEENAKLLPQTVNMLMAGVFAPADEPRALALVMRHLRCPNAQASETAESLLGAYRNRPNWKCQRAIWDHENLNFRVAMNAAEDLLYKENYAPAQALLDKFKLTAQRRKALAFATSSSAFVEAVNRDKAPFEETFTEQDLFIETPNIISRAYKSGDIVLRFLIEGEDGYGEALDFINALLAKGYAYKAKNWTHSGGFTLRVYFLQEPIAIKQMAKVKSGDIDYPFTNVHAFFARAVQYPALRPKVEQYAQLALQHDHWYTDLSAERNIVPGTFAATALAFCGLEYMPLVCHYASTIDEEHSYIHLPLPGALLKHYGVVPEVMPAVFALCQANGQGGVVWLPPNLFANGAATAAVSAYVRSLDMPKRSQFETLVHTMHTLMSSYEERNLKELQANATAAERPQDKGAFIDLHNLYLQALVEVGYDDYSHITPLSQVEGYVPLLKVPVAGQETGGSGIEEEVEIELFPEAQPVVMATKDAEKVGIDIGEIEEGYDEPVAFFCSPAVQTDFELLHFTRLQWELIGIENRKGEDRRCWTRVLSGPLCLRMGKWVVDTQRFAAEFALVLFDGKNKPLVLYGALDALYATMDFNYNPPKTPQEAEQLRLRHLQHRVPLCNGTPEALQATEVMDETTGNFLCGDFGITQAVLRHTKPEGNALVYLASRVMLAYLAQRRGDAEDLAELCGELARLQPEKREFWLEKQTLAQSV